MHAQSGQCIDFARYEQPIMFNKKPLPAVWPCCGHPSPACAPSKAPPPTCADARSTPARLRPRPAGMPQRCGAVLRGSLVRIMRGGKYHLHFVDEVDVGESDRLTLKLSVSWDARCLHAPRGTPVHGPVSCDLAVPGRVERCRGVPFSPLPTSHTVQGGDCGVG